MKTHRELIDEWRKEPEFVAEYDALADEFALFDEMLTAKKMGTVVPHRKGQAPDGSHSTRLRTTP